MNRNILFVYLAMLPVLFQDLTIGAEENNPQNLFNFVYQKAKETKDNVQNSFERKKEELKNKWFDVLDEVTGQSADEIKQEIVHGIKKEPTYQQAMIHPNEDLAHYLSVKLAWLTVRGYYLPKHAGIAYYKNCITGDKKFKAWKQAVRLANQEINAEKIKA